MKNRASDSPCKTCKFASFEWTKHSPPRINTAYVGMCSYKPSLGQLASVFPGILMDHIEKGTHQSPKGYIEPPHVLTPSDLPIDCDVYQERETV